MPRVIPGEGLFIENLRWTPEGEASVKGGHHPDLSPAIKTNDAGEVVFVHSAALCRQGGVAPKQHREAVIKFLVVAGVGFVLNGLAMALLTGPVALHYLLAQVVTTAIVMIWTFTGNRAWTFGARRPD